MEIHPGVDQGASPRRIDRCWCGCTCRTACVISSPAEGGDCGWPLANAMKQVSEAGEGVIVVLRNHDTPREIVQRMMDRQVPGAAQKRAT